MNVIRKQIPLIVRNPDGQITINEDVIKMFENTRYPVCITTVVGPPKSGKTTLLKDAISSLRYQGTFRRVVWEYLTGGEKEDEVKEFQLSITNSPELLQIGKTGHLTAVFFIDARGPLQQCVNESYALLAGLNRILTVVQVFNVKSQLDEDQMRGLEFFLETGNMMLWNTGLLRQMKTRRHIFLVIRDWAGVKDHQFGLDGGNNYLKGWLDLPESKRIKSTMEQFRGGKSCFLLEHPDKPAKVRHSTQDAKTHLLLSLFQYAKECGLSGVFGPDMATSIKEFQAKFIQRKIKGYLEERPRDLEALVKCMNKPLLLLAKANLHKNFEKISNEANTNIDISELENQLSAEAVKEVKTLMDSIYGRKEETADLIENFNWQIKSEKAAALKPFSERKIKAQLAKQIGTQNARQDYDTKISKLDLTSLEDHTLTAVHGDLAKEILDTFANNPGISDVDKEIEGMILKEYFEDNLKVLLHKLQLMKVEQEDQKAEMDLRLTKSLDCYKTNMQQILGVPRGPVQHSAIEQAHSESLEKAKEYLVRYIGKSEYVKVEEVLYKQCVHEVEKIVERNETLKAAIPGDHVPRVADQETPKDKTRTSFDVVAGACIKYMKDTFNAPVTSEASSYQQVQARVNEIESFLHRQISRGEYESHRQLFRRFKTVCHKIMDTNPKETFNIGENILTKEEMSALADAGAIYWKNIHEAKPLPGAAAMQNHEFALAAAMSMLERTNHSNTSEEWLKLFCNICKNLYHNDAAYESKKEAALEHSKSACKVAFDKYKEHMRKEFPPWQLPVRGRKLHIWHKTALFEALSYYRQETSHLGDEAVNLLADLVTCIHLYFAEMQKRNERPDQEFFFELDYDWAKKEMPQ